jgi:peptide deformylase
MELKCYPDRRLRKKCRPIREIDEEVVRRAEQMLELMYESDGLGLAGPQVGWQRQIVTIDVEGNHDGDRLFVNPRIVEGEGYVEVEEGCLSLPGIRVDVPRSEKIKLVTYTIDGKRVETELEGLAAIAWQHEVDHLNGTLIIDRLAPTKLMSIRDKLKRLEGQVEQPAE